MHLYDYDYVDEKLAKKEYRIVKLIISAFIIVFIAIAVIIAI